MASTVAGSGVKTVGNLGANYLSQRAPNSKLAAMAAGGLATAGDKFEQANRENALRTQSSGKGFLSGLGGGIQGLLEGAVGTVPGGKSLSRGVEPLLGGLFKTITTGNAQHLLSGLGRGAFSTISSPTFGSDMSKLLTKSKASDYAGGQWGYNAAQKLTPEELQEAQKGQQAQAGQTPQAGQPPQGGEQAQGEQQAQAQEGQAPAEGQQPATPETQTATAQAPEEAATQTPGAVATQAPEGAAAQVPGVATAQVGQQPQEVEEEPTDEGKSVDQADLARFEDENYFGEHPQQEAQQSPEGTPQEGQATQEGQAAQEEQPTPEGQQDTQGQQLQGGGQPQAEGQAQVGEQAQGVQQLQGGGQPQAAESPQAVEQPERISPLFAQPSEEQAQGEQQPSSAAVFPKARTANERVPYEAGDVPDIQKTGVTTPLQAAQRGKAKEAEDMDTSEEARYRYSRTGVHFLGKDFNKLPIDTQNKVLEGIVANLPKTEPTTEFEKTKANLDELKGYQKWQKARIAGKLSKAQEEAREKYFGRRWPEIERNAQEYYETKTKTEGELERLSKERTELEQKDKRDRKEFDKYDENSGIKLRTDLSNIEKAVTNLDDLNEYFLRGLDRIKNGDRSTLSDVGRKFHSGTNMNIIGHQEFWEMRDVLDKVNGKSDNYRIYTAVHEVQTMIKNKLINFNYMKNKKKEELSEFEIKNTAIKDNAKRLEDIKKAQEEVAARFERVKPLQRDYEKFQKYKDKVRKAKK
jgi:hypothetical protein